MVALGELNGIGEFEISHCLSHDLIPINSESLACTLPVGMKVKATVVTSEVSCTFLKINYSTIHI